MIKIKVFSTVLICIFCMNCTNTNRKGEKNISSEMKQEVRNKTYYTSNSYQIFENYQLAVKSPAILKDHPNANPNFTVHYGGIDDNQRENKGGYYEVCIIDWSFHHPANVIEQKFHHEILPRFLDGSEKLSMPVAGHERTVYIKTYQDGNNIGKALAFVREGVVYLFNVAGNDRIEKRFNEFISSISFYTHDEESVDVLLDRVYQEDITEDILETLDLKQHRSIKYNYSIKHPEEWLTMEDYNQMIVFVAEDELSSKNFNIVIINNVKRNLHELVEGNKADMKHTFPDALVKEEYLLRVNGMESIRVDVEATNLYGSGKQYNSMYSFLHKNKLYIVNFGCSIEEADNYKDTIRKIISSFVIDNHE